MRYYTKYAKGRKEEEEEEDEDTGTFTAPCRWEI